MTISPKLRRAQFDCELARPNGGVYIEPGFTSNIRPAVVAFSVGSSCSHLTALESLSLYEGLSSVSAMSNCKLIDGIKWHSLEKV